MFSGYESSMNQHHGLVTIKKMIKAASDLDDIDAIRDQLHTMLLVANNGLLPVQRKPSVFARDSNLAVHFPKQNFAHQQKPARTGAAFSGPGFSPRFGKNSLRGPKRVRGCPFSVQISHQAWPCPDM
jgi:hypothetical protein